MEWWYKSDRYSVTSESITKLQNLLHNKLVEGRHLSIASLYDDGKFFYIRTSNNIFLHGFLFEHGFDEVYSKPKTEMALLYGVED